MDLHEYLKKMKNIQKNILEFIERDSISIDDLNIYFNYLKQKENLNYLKEVLHLISKITKNHQSTTRFYEKIEQILQIFKDEICENFTIQQILNYFIDNKRIILFLFNSGIILPDQTIASIFSNSKYLERKYLHFFYPEISTFLSPKMSDEIKKEIETNYNSEQFLKLREKGENDSYICQLIRDDLNDDFISYVSHSNYQLTEAIEPSIFETNSLLIKNKPTLIEYSAFFGSIHIFKYLFLNKVELNPSLWLYAIHGGSSGIIHILEDCEMNIPDDYFQSYLIEAIKCHHNQLANYFETNLNRTQISIDSEKVVFRKSLQFFNYKFLPHEIGQFEELFDDLCKNDYLLLVDFFLKSKSIQINLSHSLVEAVRKGNYEITHLLLENPEIDINYKYIFNQCFFI